MKYGTMKIGMALCAGMLSMTAQAQFVPPVEFGDVNVIGLGVGSAPDYMGSANNTGGAAPIARYQFKGTERYVLLMGPQLQVNLLDDANWRFGPMVNYRFGRDNDVEDKVVKRMTEVDGAVEGGVFVNYNYKLSSAKMHKLVFGADVAGGSNGTVGNLRMNWWQPIGEGRFMTLGVGAKITNDKWARTYFGVTETADIALFPSLGGRPFDADGGVTSYYIPFGITQALNREWLVSAGGRYEGLLGDAKDSPVTNDRGDSSQWIFGLGVSYLFQ